ncbi:MAG: Fe-S cluster assembly ATPase SufC [Clostridia bacterium]|nr:Fe-S cluster assembly ATPase SufC [Clostridia bacterium]
MEKLLEIKNVYASTKGKQILKGLNLTINKGETHVIMGPNGAGKTTLGNVILNNPAYKLDKGKIFLDGIDASTLTTDEIAKKGVFMSFQHPVELEGVSTLNFIKTVKTKKGEKTTAVALKNTLSKQAQELQMPETLLSRDLNVGFSGGEKKKNEILQLLSLNPRLAILDETDSGLDVDAIKIVSKGIDIYKSPENALLIITHSSKILQSLDIDYVHILVDGKIVKTGGPKLIKEIELHGYANFRGDN